MQKLFGYTRYRNNLMRKLCTQSLHLNAREPNILMTSPISCLGRHYIKSVGQYDKIYPLLDYIGFSYVNVLFFETKVVYGLFKNFYVFAALDSQFQLLHSIHLSRLTDLLEFVQKAIACFLLQLYRSKTYHISFVSWTFRQN